MKSQSNSAGPGKRLAEEEKKGTLDARELVARFRSKKDLYDYLVFQSMLNYQFTL